jgi:hypothetical protein
MADVRPCTVSIHVESKTDVKLGTHQVSFMQFVTVHHSFKIMLTILLFSGALIS